MPPSEPSVSNAEAVTPAASLMQSLWQLIRFGLVGFTCMALYFVLLYGIHQLTALPVSVQGALAYGPCMVVNYLLHRTFTFRSRGQHLHVGPRYVTVQLVSMATNSGVLWLG